MVPYLLFSGGFDGAIQVWNYQQRKCIHVRLGGRSEA